MKEMCEMKGQGRSIRGIARELGVSRNSVRKYLKSSGVPRQTPRRRRASKLDPYTDHIDGRLSEGLENCVVLLRELRALGYSGGYTIVKDYISRAVGAGSLDPRLGSRRVPVSRLRSTGVAWRTSQRTAASAECGRS